MQKYFAITELTGIRLKNSISYDHVLSKTTITLKRIKIKPGVSKSTIKPKLKSNPLTEVRSTRSKNKSETTITKTTRKTKTMIRIRFFTGQDLIDQKKTPHAVATKYEER